MLRIAKLPFVTLFYHNNLMASTPNSKWSLIVDFYFFPSVAKTKASLIWVHFLQSFSSQRSGVIWCRNNQLKYPGLDKVNQGNIMDREEQIKGGHNPRWKCHTRTEIQAICGYSWFCFFHIGRPLLGTMVNLIHMWCSGSPQ